MIGLAFIGALIAGLILAIAFVPTGPTLQDAEDDAHKERGLFGVLLVLAFIALVFVI